MERWHIHLIVTPEPIMRQEYPSNDLPAPSPSQSQQGAQEPTAFRSQRRLQTSHSSQSETVFVPSQTCFVCSLKGADVYASNVMALRLFMHLPHQCLICRCHPSIITPPDFWSPSTRHSHPPAFNHPAFKSHRRVTNVRCISIWRWRWACGRVLMILRGLRCLFMASLLRRHRWWVAMAPLVPLCFDAPLQRFSGDTPNLRLRFPRKASAFVVEGRKGLLLTESVQHWSIENNKALSLLPFNNHSAAPARRFNAVVFHLT